MKQRSHASPPLTSTGSGFTLVELMVVVVILGILAVLATPAYISMQSRSKEASVRSNAHTVQLAAEDFAAQSDGVYAAAAGDLTPNGDNLQALLPNGQLLTNPFNGNQDSPVFGAPGAGQCGYQPHPVFGAGLGYQIQAADNAGMVILTLSNG